MVKPSKSPRIWKLQSTGVLGQDVSLASLQRRHRFSWILQHPIACTDGYLKDQSIQIGFHFFWKFQDPYTLRVSSWGGGELSDLKNKDWVLVEYYGRIWWDTIESLWDSCLSKWLIIMIIIISIIPFWSEKSPAISSSSTNTVLLIHVFAVFKIMLKCDELHWPGTGVRCNKSFYTLIVVLLIFSCYLATYPCLVPCLTAVLILSRGLIGIKIQGTNLDGTVGYCNLRH
jgi:hypothetical protein